MTEREDPSHKQEPNRKPYSPPTLVEYGNIAKLTQFAVGSGADGGMMGSMMGMSTMMMCL